MHELRRIVFLTYSGAELLDFAGPSAVFSTANRLSHRTLYEIVVASVGQGNVAHSCGIALATEEIDGMELGATDTVLVIGADSRQLVAAAASAGLRNCLKAAAMQAERYGSICTGVFVLAAAGLLTGKSVATHWAATSQLARLYSDINCDADALYVTDGKLWTSAGVTTGIDMALAMLEHDHGAALKAAVARQLVVYAHRPGHQSQYSDLLAAQAKEDERFSGLTAWLREHTGTPISVEGMADYVGMSVRTFHRRFFDSFGQTPARFFEAMRLYAARDLLEAQMPVGNVALKSGFQSESAFRCAFKSHFGVTPQLYRETWRAR
jgi:transcriptional regulator GlxA family with amidase domain